MITALENTNFMLQFLTIAQPLPVYYEYGKGISKEANIVVYRVIGRGLFRKALGNQLLSEEVSYIVTVVTETARENMIFTEMIKLATEGTSIKFVSEGATISGSAKGRCTNNIVLTLYSSIVTQKVYYDNEQVKEALDEISRRYAKAVQLFGIDLQESLTAAAAVEIPEGQYDFSAIVLMKQEYLDRLVAAEALTSVPSNTRTGVQRAQMMRRFLETVQPLPVQYGYARGVQDRKCFITYQDIGTTGAAFGVGNQLISERTAFMITVQTETAQQNMFFTDLIKLGTQESDVEFITDNMRRDSKVTSGWINSIVLYVYNNINSVKVVFTATEVQQQLQAIADRYIFVTSIYRKDLETSFLDKMKVPQPADRLYSYEEFIAMKQEYLDRLLYTTTEY